MSLTTFCRGGPHRAALCCLGALASSGAMAAPRRSAMPPGAFLRLPAPDVSALVRQVKRDEAVRTRYARLFRLAPADVGRAFATLRSIRLPQDRLLQVHYAPKGGGVGFRLRRVRRGTPVYALRDGTPVLAQVCGNPLRSSMSGFGEPPPPVTGGGETAIPDFAPFEPLPERAGPSLVFAPQMRSARPAEDFGPDEKNPTPASGGGGGGGASGGISGGAAFALPGLAAALAGLAGLSELFPGDGADTLRSADLLPRDHLPALLPSPAQAQKHLNEWARNEPELRVELTSPDEAAETPPGPPKSYLPWDTPPGAGAGPNAPFGPGPPDAEVPEPGAALPLLTGAACLLLKAARLRSSRRGVWKRRGGR